MPPKSTEKTNKNKKDTSIAHQIMLSKDSNIIETTYEKVLSIINRTKDFIKKTFRNAHRLIDDLDWVIKVISNKSLYSYEIKKPTLNRQNSEFNKFVNFVTKYNEEVIEMNQKHALVTGLLNIVSKREVLKRPSVCLKKILPEELKNMDYQKEKDKKNRKKNLINLIGNFILNLYYKTIEKQKNENEEKEKKNLSKQNTENKGKFNNYQLKDKNSKKLISDRNTKSKNKNNFDNKGKNLMENYNTSYSVGKRKKDNNDNSFIKIGKNDKASLSTIRKTMENYYFKYALTESEFDNKVKENIIKDNLIKENINQKKNVQIKKNISSQKGKNHTYLKKVTMPYRSYKNKFYRFEEENHNKSFDINKNNSRIIKNKLNKTIDNHNDINENKNKAYVDIYNNDINKTHIQKIIRIKYKQTPEEIKKNKAKKAQKEKEKNNISNDNNNENNNKNENNNINQEIHSIVKDPDRIPLNILLEQYFNDLKMITDKDFNIFEFKEKVGYKNVLPLMCHGILKVLGLLDNRIITLSKLESFLFSVSDNYKESTLYHNSLHGADVTQSLCVYFIRTNAEQICETSVLDLLGMIISAMGHDLGHPGLTNNFHINASTNLALTYNDASCLENFHCSFLFKILKKDENNIFDKLTVENYKNIRKRMIKQILATDMANHGEVMSLIRTKIRLFQEQEENQDDSNTFILLSGNEKTKFDEQQILLNYLIHMADLGHNCKKYEISKQWVRVLCEEFWIQGDKEKSLGIPVSFLCDREKIDVPASQVNFLKGFVISSFDSLVAIFPDLKFTMENAQNNISEWQKLLDEKRVTGWTPKNEKEEEKEDNKNDKENKEEKDNKENKEEKEKDLE